MKIVQYQAWHLLILLALLLACYFIIQSDTTILNGDIWGIDTWYWLVLAIASPIIHQVYVLICWRTELYHKSISGIFGKHGFKLYKVGFTILILSRVVTIVLLAVSNAGTVDTNPTYAYLLSGILVVPAVYLFYSVVKYFGMDRAFGIDHFQPEEAGNQPFVKGGIFKYTNNGMYIYGFMLLWVPGLLTLSKAALLAALFNHIYIWVHYYSTELPDIRKIYGPQE